MIIIILLTYKALNNLAPVYLSDLLQYRVDWGSRRDNTLLLLDSKINRVTLGGKSICQSSFSALEQYPTKPPSQCLSCLVQEKS